LEDIALRVLQCVQAADDSAWNKKNNFRGIRYNYCDRRQLIVKLSRTFGAHVLKFV